MFAGRKNIEARRFSITTAKISKKISKFFEKKVLSIAWHFGNGTLRECTLNFFVTMGIISVAEMFKNFTV